MLTVIKEILVTLFLVVGCTWTFVFAQSPTTQPDSTATTKPSTIVTTQPTTQATTQSATLAIDSLGVDTLGLPSTALDTTSIERKLPPKKRRKVAPQILSNEIYYFYHNQPKEVFEFKDTIIDTPFFQYDPARKGKYDYATLGTVAGPMQSLHYRWENKYGSRIGIDEVFKPYIRDESETRFYTKSKAFTDVYYSQGAEQNDHVFHGDFGRSFDNGIKFSLSHDRLIHSLNNSALALNTNAFYAFPATKNTSLLTGFAFQKEDNNYQAFLTYAHNEINQIYNGGLETNGDVTIEAIDSILLSAENRDNGISIPNTIENQSATLRYRLRTVALDHYLTFSGKNDSSSVSSRIFNLNHKVKFTRDLYRFSETVIDSAYYQNLITDTRGLRVAINQTIVENYFGLSTLKTKNGEIIPSILGDINLGLRHQYANFDFEASERRFNNLFAEGSWKVSPFKGLTLDVFGQIGLLDNIGDFRLNAKAILNLNKWGNLEGRLNQQRFEPSIFANQNYVTQTEVWNLGLSKSFNSELGFTYRLPSFDLEAGLSLFILDNQVYFTNELIPAQRSGAINLFQLYFKKDFKWKILHLENLVMLQSSTDNDVIRLPNWWSKHSFFLQRRIFKNIMLARLGLDLRLNAPYFANGFNPVLAQFYVQSEREVDLYPAVDAHFGFVVEKFRIFVKMENLTTLVNDNIFYQIPFYPQKELSFRFGISWRFLDRNSNKAGETNTSPNNRGQNPTSRPSTGGRPF